MSLTLKMHLKYIFKDKHTIALWLKQSYPAWRYRRTLPEGRIFEYPSKNERFLSTGTDDG